MDGINGIAAITGTAGFSMLAAYNALSGGDGRFSVLSMCIAFSCLGFLPFNIPKARVFMGDVGSILLGFVFAAMVVMLSRSFLEFVCLASLLFPFYADEWTTMAVRIRDGENLLKPHRRHLYQLLANEMGIEHWKVSVGYGILQIVVGACVLSAMPYGPLAVWTLLVIFFSMFVWLNYIVRARIKGK
jgi:Fuc2NAc and GlcNAc transferase